MFRTGPLLITAHLLLKRQPCINNYIISNIVTKFKGVIISINVDVDWLIPVPPEEFVLHVRIENRVCIAKNTTQNQLLLGCNKLLIRILLSTIYCYIYRCNWGTEVH